MRLIDADKFKENILSGLYVFCQENKDDIARAIDDEPAVDKDRYSEGYAQGYVDGHTSASNVSGTWIYKEYSYYCSNCNRNALDQEDYPYLSAYCPFCGAEMEIKEQDMSGELPYEE